MPFAVKTTRAGGVFILKPDTNRQSPVLSKTAEINKKNTHQTGVKKNEAPVLAW